MTDKEKLKKLSVIFYVLLLSLIATPIIWDIILHYSAFSWNFAHIFSCTIVSCLIALLVLTAVQEYNKLSEKIKKES
jgi:putative effector of murein hydrolase LrgA (UPF0299 family)